MRTTKTETGEALTHRRVAAAVAAGSTPAGRRSRPAAGHSRPAHPGEVRTPAVAAGGNIRPGTPKVSEREHVPSTKRGTHALRSACNASPVRYGGYGAKERGAYLGAGSIAAAGHRRSNLCCSW